MSVRLRARKSKGRYVTYEITLPKKIVEALNWREGMLLKVRVLKINSTTGIFLAPQEIE